MKCNNRCIYYIEDTAPDRDNRSYGGRAHIHTPGCRLNALIILGYKTEILFHDFYDIPIMAEDCPIEKERIKAAKELIGIYEGD